MRTNIEPLSDLKYQFIIQDLSNDSILSFMPDAESVTNQNEISKVYTSPTDLTLEQANNYAVYVHVYEDWWKSGSRPRFLGTLGYFATSDKYKNLPPIHAKTTTATTKPASENSVTVVSIKDRRIFTTKEHPHLNNDPKDPFRWNVIEQQLISRLRPNQHPNKTYPDQKYTNLCGPAAYFYCLQRDRKDLYAQAVKELWEVGQTQINHLTIKAGDAAKPKNFFNEADEVKILGIDWVTMGSLRDSGNILWDYDSPDDAVSAITGTGTLFDWLAKSGAQNIQDLTKYPSSNNINELLQLNEYAKKGYTVVQLMNSPNTFGGEDGINWKTHWIV